MLAEGEGQDSMYSPAFASKYAAISPLADGLEGGEEAEAHKDAGACPVGITELSDSWLEVMEKITHGFWSRSRRFSYL
jgi:hypothetical protein